MGFKREAKVYKLVWPEDHENHGLEVRMRGLAVGELAALGGMADLGGPATAEALAALDDLLRLFASKLVGWNLDDDQGEPVPATYDGVQTLDNEFVMQLVDAWMTATAGVSPPLSPSSIGGGTSLAGSIPMEPLSASRAS